MSLYLLINILSVAVPLLLSFDKKLKFVRLWPAVLPAILVTSALFVINDIIFTSAKVWGFNPAYLQGIYMAGLPLEEYLFFILIPYSCLFIHYVYVLYSGDFRLSPLPSKIIAFNLSAVLLVLALIFKDRTYTLINSLFSVILLTVSQFFRPALLRSFFLSFLIMLIPFLAVNAVLTGSFIDSEVVWYSSSAITGARILTIPVEDFWYALNLILMNLLIAEEIRCRMKINVSAQ